MGFEPGFSKLWPLRSSLSYPHHLTAHVTTVLRVIFSNYRL